MDILGASAAQAATPATQGVLETTNNSLGQDDFFKLLTTQLTSQDPLEPMQDTEFIAQMAQFSSLAQMEAIAQNTEASKLQQQTSAILALLGKSVEADGADGERLSGVISRVELVDGEMVPFIGNTQVSYGSITNISEPADSDSNGSADEDESPTSV